MYVEPISILYKYHTISRSLKMRGSYLNGPTLAICT